MAELVTAEQVGLVFAAEAVEAAEEEVEAVFELVDGEVPGAGVGD